jgi:hypothetical protein
MGTLAVVFLRATPRGSIAGAPMHNSPVSGVTDRATGRH